MSVWSALPALLAAVGILWYAYRRPIFGYTTFFLIFMLTWRLVSAAFIEMFGPVYAIELLDEVGGNGGAIMFTAAIVLTFGVFAWMLRSEALRRAVGPQLEPVPRNAITLGDLTCYAFSLFLVLLYLDFFRRGVIPLLAGMERQEYTEKFAGPLHQWFFEFANLIAFGLGTLCIYPRFRGAAADLRFVGLIIAVFVYAVLAGHRFSIFFSVGTFFVLPRAALYIRHPGEISNLWPDTKLRRFLVSRPLRWMLAVVMVVGIIGAMVNSYLNTRGFAGGLALLSFGQRVFVQPSEMWFVTYERVVLHGVWDPAYAADFIFFDPIDPTRATSIQYLMTLALGGAMATEVTNDGVAYNGGFPEIFFELFGPYGAWLAILGLALLTAYLAREILLAICQGRLLTAVTVLYVCYAFLLTYAGGMLNQLVALTFWVKVTMAACVLVAEKRPGQASRPLVPYVVWLPRSLHRPQLS